MDRAGQLLALGGNQLPAAQAGGARLGGGAPPDRAQPCPPARAGRARVVAGSAGIDTLLTGTGTEVWLAPTDLREARRRYHVGVDTMLTGPAIRTYNIMLGERRRVAAALIAVP